MGISNKIQHLRELLRIEEKAQEERFFQENVSLKELRSEGTIIHPVRIQNKTFGFTDQPIVTLSFHIPGGVNYSFYSQGTPVALFNSVTNEVCNGQLLNISDNSAEIILHSHDFPDWIDEKGIGVKRLADDKSFKLMHGVLNRIEKEESKALVNIFKIVHQLSEPPLVEETEQFVDDIEDLNASQREAIRNGLNNVPIQLIHGPPGTGKTTTIVALMKLLREKGKTIIASAPSNAAIDYLAEKLLEKGLKVLRLGNTAKVNKVVWEHTPEGILSQDKLNKQIKRLKIRAEEYRKMARQYKRNFGKAEREQRKLLFKEVYAIRDEIKSLSDYYLAQFFEEADVILGTPVGLTDPILNDKTFDVAFLDEAGQCIEPLAWLVLEKGNRAVLSGDHLQLPPTVISQEVERELSISVLERAMLSGVKSDLLQVQYRMTPEIAGFSSRYFYEGKLQSNPSSIPDSLLFFDTAGAGFIEKREENHRSIHNPEELRIISEHWQEWCNNNQSVVFISPYSAQVEQAKKLLKSINVSTIDSFQGQEADVVILSLVRSNDEGKIGFLSDHRRMNVAMTRARTKLIVVGDSTTLANDDFYQQFIAYSEEIGAYRSVFELMY